MNESQENKARQITNSKSRLRKFADWWETTSVETFLGDVEYLLQKSALLSIINLLASITIIISLITWWTGRKERWEDEIFATWQVVNDASEDKSGVARLAVVRLFKNNFSLRGLDLSKTNLIGINLQGANLYEVNLQQAELMDTNLKDVDLNSAKLQQAYLMNAKLQRASLWEANLERAVLEKANLQNVYLRRANLEGAILIDAKIMPTLIKSACNWNKAIYKGKEKTYRTWVAIEPDNTNYIEELKKDKSSDPRQPVDCTRWSK